MYSFKSKLVWISLYIIGSYFCASEPDLCLPGTSEYSLCVIIHALPYVRGIYDTLLLTPTRPSSHASPPRLWPGCSILGRRGISNACLLLGCLRLIEQQARPRISRPLPIHSTHRPPAYCGEHNGLRGHVNHRLSAPSLSLVSFSC